MMNISDFVRLYQIRSPRIMWLLGAGTSAAGGIPTAYHLIWRFKQMLFCSEQHVSVQSCSDLGDPILQSRIQHYFDSKGGFPKPGSDDEYAHYFEAAIPDEADRQRYIAELMRGAAPSFGHIALAALMKLSKLRLLWTTNFDPLIEDAAATVFGSSSKLTVGTVDAPQIAAQAIVDERYPVLVKLHGDFRSRSLKNTIDELRVQDAELRRNLIDTSKRFGLAVCGYSGRDESIMEALWAVAKSDNKSFPSGFFWFHYPENPCSQKVRDLVDYLRSTGREAEVIELSSFDELMEDLLLLIPDIPPEVQRHITASRARISDIPLPKSEGAWPIIRLNALPITQYPTICRRVVCNIGGMRDIREAITRVDSRILAARRRLGVIAFGRDSAVRSTFEAYDIKEFDVHSFEARRLKYESAEYGLLYDALGTALERERPLKVFRRRQGHIAVIDTKRSDFRVLKEALKSVEGIVPGTSIQWAEAIRFRLEYKLDQLWLLIEPTIWISSTNDDDAKARAKQFVQQRLATRYNWQWNAILDVWGTIIVNAGKVSSIRAFGIGDGCDAAFTISRIPAFSWRGK